MIFPASNTAILSISVKMLRESLRPPNQRKHQPLQAETTMIWPSLGESF